MKVRFLFWTVQHNSLADAIESLKFRDYIGSKTLKFTEDTNNLSAQVSILPESVSKVWGISGVKRDHGAKHTGEKGIYKKDGLVYTGFYKNWGGFYPEDKTKVIDERSCLGTNKAIPKKENYCKTEAASRKKALGTLNKDMKEANRMISSLKRKRGMRDSDDHDSEEETPDNYGDRFGGYIEKKKGKCGD